MNRAEAARLLTVASGFDRREVSELTATAWQSALAEFDYAECEAAVVAHFRDAATRHAYLTVGHVLDRVEAARRLSVREVAVDVRSAKARGLIGRDWPVSEPLPEQVAVRLASARANDRAVLEVEAGAES